MTQATPFKVRIAMIWLVVAALVICVEFVFPFLAGHSTMHRCYYLRAVEYESGIRVFDYFEDEEVMQSFVEGGDPDAFTPLGLFIIGMYPRTDFELFRPWVTSSGVSQISPVFSPSAQRLLSHNELIHLVLTESEASLNSDDPMYAFERMQVTGFLDLIANNPAPVTKVHPTNIAIDVLIAIILTGAVLSAVYLLRVRISIIQAKALAHNCPSCGYPREGLGAFVICPECGDAFPHE